MIIVDIYDMGDDGEWEKVGDVMFNESTLSGTGEGEDLISEPLECHDQTGNYSIDPKTEPERFIKALPQVFKGSYCRAVTRQADVVASLEVPITLGD